MARSQLSYGSQGDDVKYLQEFLNTQGHNLTVDGIFGANTQAAVKSYQQKNGLSVDGIVGTNTWGSIEKLSAGAASSGSTSANKSNTFTYGDYKESDTVQTAGTNATNAANAVKNYGEFSYGNQATLDDVINKILNREKFSYDLNGDALYQQYKDKYMQQGKIAMQDTMGQAAAMTGGYGNSYAVTAGNQAYQASLEKLNDVVPELWQMAYDQYHQEGQDMYNQYSLLSDDRATKYSEWQDGYNRAVADRDYYQGVYDSERSYDYGKWQDGRDFAYGQHRDSIADEQWQATFDEGLRQYNEQFAYQKDRDKISDEQWQKQYDALYGNTGSGSSGSSGSGGGSGSGGSGSSGGSGGGSGTGNGGGTTTTATIPDSIHKKAAEFTDNESLATWAYSLEDSGAIAEGQAAQLISLYFDHNEKTVEVDDGNGNKSTKASYSAMVKSTSGWSVVNDGGTNWFWGVDNNAIVKAPNGKNIRLDNLVDYLVDEGMSKSDAKSYVKKLQKNLGI